MAVTTDEILGGSPQIEQQNTELQQPNTPQQTQTPTDQEQNIKTDADDEHEVEVETDKETTIPVDEQQTGTVPRMSYVEMFQKMSPYKPPTEEELEKERKKQKRESIFAAIGEGISAMSNLYFTTQYAPNAFDPSKGLAATTKQRFDKLKKEREDNQRQYMEGYLRALKMDADDAKTERAWQHTLEREKVTDRWREAAEQRKAAEDEYKAQKRSLDLQFLQGKIDRQDYLNEQERLETEYMKKNGMKMPTTPKPSTGGGRRSGGGGGSGNMKTYPAYNPTTGETIYIQAKDSKHAWSQCPEGYTIRQEPSKSESTRTTTDRRGKTKGSATTETTKNGNDELHGPQTGNTKRKPNPMGSDSSGNTKKKKNPMS